MVIRIGDPMTYNANILLGRISKLHGFEGAVTVKLEKTFVENIPEMESVFIEIDGKPVPFFITRSDYRGSDILRLVFDGYDTIDKVNEFTGCRVFLTVGKENKPAAEISVFHNYKICLPDDTLVGKIRNIMENPDQWLLEIISSDGKELLIPFHEDLVRSIDKKKKVIKMDLPDGLTDLNK
jgi:16S rRNA processing protein RimM